MHLLSILALAATATVAAAADAAAAPTAVAPDDIDFACVRTQKEYTALVPKCAQKCHALGLTTDGCGVDDHICHCKNFLGVSAIIEPCIRAPQPPCSADDIQTFGLIGQAYCTFWNATADRAERRVFKKHGEKHGDGSAAAAAAEDDGEDDDGDS